MLWWMKNHSRRRAFGDVGRLWLGCDRSAVLSCTTTHFQPFLDDLSYALGNTVMVLPLALASCPSSPVDAMGQNHPSLVRPTHYPALDPIEHLWQGLKAAWKGQFPYNGG